MPDPRGRLPGRGAHLHPTPDCLALAERRRAIGRALRLTEAFDVTPVRDWVAARSDPAQQDTAAGRNTAGWPKDRYREGRTTTMSARWASTDE